MVFILSQLPSAVCSNKNKQSRAVAVNSGVPQGSVLGPLLFLLYINDLPNRVTVPIRLFADDCVVYSRIETEHDQVNLNNNLQRIKDWCEEWQMSLNTEKTVFMTITRKKAPLDYNYQIGNAFLKRVQNYKYLGLWFTPDLRWNTHIDNVCSRATKALYSLRRNLYTAPSDIKCLAYKTLVRPIIEYSKIVWDPYTKTNCNKITKYSDLVRDLFLINIADIILLLNSVKKLDWIVLNLGRGLSV
uniref:Putative endonuclease/reverse transcriptase n=1 Tax=Rhipicephalus microplus TaxID=6941 RepID=A0A6G5AAA0_RHIMP